MKLFRRTKPVVDLVRADLLNAMHVALIGFTKALQKYEQNTDAPVAYSQMLFAEAQMYREAYYEARLKYELHYGNADNYNESLARLKRWIEERSMVCLFKHPHDTYTSVAKTS